MSHRGRVVLREGPRLLFWRAPTDNDVGGSKRQDATDWMQAGLHRLQHRLDGVERAERDGAVTVTVRERVAPPVLEIGIQAEYVYTIGPDGGVLLEVHGAPAGRFPPSIPRIGLIMTLPRELERVAWYGLGPGESYPDSRQAVRVGLWESRVGEMTTRYEKPQENGSRSDARWATVTDGSGAGLRLRGEPRFCFSAHRLTPWDFGAARHFADLSPRAETVLVVDHARHGLGTASCGPGVLPRYVLEPREFRFRLALEGLGARG
jgi:beta-galactosidase